MSKKTIAKFCVFVILVAASAGCAHLDANDREDAEFDRNTSPYDVPKEVGRLESKKIAEASGLAASKCSPGVLWTHNDSGDAAFIYAVSTSGKDLGAWKVTGAENQDWEDIAAIKDASGECMLYIGDIGNNGKKKGEGTIYKVPEPKIGSTAPENGSQLATAPAEALNFTLGSKGDAETLLVAPDGKELYVLTKRKEGPSEVYKITSNFGAPPVKGVKIAEITLPAILTGLLTGGDVSPDGRHVVLCDYVAGYELSLPDGATSFDDIFNQKPVRFDVGKREMGEAIAYSADGNSVFSTSEGVGAPLFQMARKN
jgi:hypothetical protein